MSIAHRCHPILVVFVWELTNETINLPLGCLWGAVKNGGEAAGAKGTPRPGTTTPHDFI